MSGWIYDSDPWFSTHFVKNLKDFPGLLWNIIPWLSWPQIKFLHPCIFTNNPLLDPTHSTLYTLIFSLKKGVSVSVYNVRDIVACSRPWESRVREIEKVWTRKYFRVPFTFTSSPLSESLEQEGDIGKLLQKFMFDRDSRHHLEAWKKCDAVPKTGRLLY